MTDIRTLGQHYLYTAARGGTTLPQNKKFLTGGDAESTILFLDPNITSIVFPTSTSMTRERERERFIASLERKSRPSWHWILTSARAYCDIAIIFKGPPIMYMMSSFFFKKKISSPNQTKYTMLCKKKTPSGSLLLHYKTLSIKT